MDDIEAFLSRVVSEDDTAAAYDPTLPAAASTPFVLGLAEMACHIAVREILAEQEITVGTWATIEHIAPSPVGTRLTAHAKLTKRGRSSLFFSVEVRSGDIVIARAQHRRVIVNTNLKRDD